MDSPSESPPARASASSHPRKKLCTEAKRASALSAKKERGRVKDLHRQNTLMYYASSRNQASAMPLEVAGSTMPIPSFPVGSHGSNGSAPAQTEPGVPAPALDAAVGDSTAGAAASPTSEFDARHEGRHRHADCIIISSTSEDGGAETTNDLDELEEVSVSDSDGDFDEDIDSIAPKKKPKKNYDLTQKFQLEWACKLPWAEGILTNNGRLHMVKCTVWSTMEKSDRLMQPKWDTLKKHEGRRKATRNMPAYNVKKGEWYMAKDSKHKKNMALFNARAPDTVLQQLNQSNRLEREKKKVQFATDELFVFKGIVEGTHDHIHTRWVHNDPENPNMFDLNSDAENLAFVVNGGNMYAKRANEETGKMEPITREAFASIVDDVKKQCSGLYP